MSDALHGLNVPNYRAPVAFPKIEPTDRAAWPPFGSSSCRWECA